MSRRVLGDDETWSGEVRLEEDALVPRGARLRLKGGALTAAAGAALVVEGELEADGAALDLAVHGTGGVVRLRGCSLRGALSLRGLGHELKDCALEGAAAAVSLRDGSARLRAVSARGCDKAVQVLAGGELDWAGGTLAGGGIGLLVEGGRARASGLRFEGLKQGVRVHRGEAALEDLAALGCDGPCAGVHGEGFASVARLRAPGGQALTLEAGHAHLLGPVEGAVLRGGTAVLCAPGWAIPSSVPDAARRAVLAAAAFAPAAALLRLAAAGAVRVFAAWARRRPEAASAWAHRSWAAGGWEPGHSDIDLALSLAPDAPPWWAAAAQGMLSRWRRRFPAYGELSVAEEAEWSAAAAAGHPRPAEWAAGQAVVLKGRLPPAPAPAPAGAAAGARLEAALAYHRLMDLCFAPGAPAQRLAREAEKNAVDLLRYLEPGLAAPRDQARERLLASPAWGPRLKELRRAPSHEAVCRLTAALALSLGGGRPVPPGGGGSVPYWLDAAARDLDLPLLGARFDTLHHRFVALAPGADESRLGAGLAAWARREAASEVPGPLPIVLPAAAWSWWAATPHEHFPAGLSAAAEHEGAGAAFPGCERFSWGAPPPPPAREEAAAALALAAADLRCVRRGLALQAVRSPAARHLLLSRCAALALALRGKPAPDFDLDAALAALRRADAPSAEALAAACGGELDRLETLLARLPASAPAEAAA